MKKIILLLGLMLSMALTGCNATAVPGDTNSTEPEQTAAAPEDTPTSTPADTPSDTSADTPADAPSDTSTAAPADTPSDTPTAEESAAESQEEPELPTGGQTATLYIGTRAAGFAEYPLSYEGALTPELLIQGIADLTGWNLTLAESVSTGKGGMSVCLSGESSLFMGPPDPQKEDFHMYSAEQLAETILDSIQKTLQKGFTGEGGDPDALDIYYYMEGELPLELPALGLSWPLDEPYTWKTPEAESPD